VTNPIPEISVREAAHRAAAGEVLLLDVRENSEWMAGHADRAIHVPLGSLNPSALPTHRPVVTVCRSGNRSGKAASALAAVGVNVINMAGGMNAWVAAGLPVVRDDGSAGFVA